MPATKIAYRQVGEGPVLILFHGYAGSVLHWDAIVEKLRGQFRIVIPNLSHLYMGREPLTFSQQIEEVARFIRHYFPKQKVHLGGISYGGALVWGLTLRYPEMVDKTIFINPMPPAPVGSFHVPILKWIFRLPLNPRLIYWILSTGFGRHFLRRAAQVFRLERADFWERFRELKGQKLKFVSHVIYNFAYILKKENWHAWKVRLEVWTHMSLLIYDCEDPLFEPKTYQRFQDLIGCDITQELHKAGHIAIQSQPDEIAQMMAEFLNVERSTTAA